MVSQLDLISNTMKIFDQRIQNLEGHITTLSNRHKKGFVQKQPPYMGDYQYLMENSNSYLPNSSIKNNDEFQKYTNQNNLDYYTANIYNPNSTFKNIVNINEENKKDMFKTEIDINKINENSQQIPQNQNDNMYMGQLHEEYGSNIGEKQPEGNNEQFEQNEYINEQPQNEEGKEEYEEGQEENIEQQDNHYEEGQGEKYEEMQGEEEQYEYEEQYYEGNYDEEQMGENGEEEMQYDYNNENNEEENNIEDNNNINNEGENPK